MSRSFDKPATRAVAEEVLADIGLDGSELTGRHGWTNAAWLGPTHVVRISDGRLRGSFAHEARVVRQLHGVPVATVVAQGGVPAGAGAPPHAEWIVTERAEGETLAVRWPSLDADERRRVGAQLGGIICSVAAHDLSDEPEWWRAAHVDQPWNAYRPDVRLGTTLLDAVAQLPDVDEPIVRAARRFSAARMRAFEGSTTVFVHGDVHGHNLLVAGDGADVRISALLDWEGAQRGPPELELDMLLRWTAAAHAMGERPDAPPAIEPGDCDELVAHVAAAAPALFDDPDLVEKLEIHDLHWHCVQLLFDRRRRDEHGDDGTRSDAWARLALLLDGATPHLRLLRR